MLCLFYAPHLLANTDVGKYDPEEIKKHPWLIATIVALVVCYFILLFVCWRIDEQDRKTKLGIAIMADEVKGSGDPDVHYYLVTVITGCRWKAGTTSNVYLRLYGVEGRSAVYLLKDQETSALNRGSIDTFFISSKRHLGEIEKIRIWHDNTGSSPSWYCSKVLVKDFQCDDEWCFFVHKWLHVHKNESTIVYEQDVAKEHDFKRFSRRYRENFYDLFDSSHLWFSVFRYTAASGFTRCQRISCGFGILTSYMLLNIMYYKHEEDTDGELGWFKPYLVTVQVTLMAYPFGMILIYMFKLTTQRYVTTLIIWRNRKRMKSIFLPGIADSPFSDLTEDDDILHSVSGSSGTGSSGTGGTTASASTSTNARDHRDQRPMSVLESLVEDHVVHACQFFRSENEKPPKEKSFRRERRPGIYINDDDLDDLLAMESAVTHMTTCKRIPGILFETCMEKPQDEAWYSLPWWFIYIAWTVCIFSILSCFYFVLLYGFENNYLTSERWLLGIVISFIVSVFISQPVNIAGSALLYTLMCPDSKGFFHEGRFQIVVRDGLPEFQRRPKQEEVAAVIEVPIAQAQAPKPEKPSLISLIPFAS